MSKRERKRERESESESESERERERERERDLTYYTYLGETNHSDPSFNLVTQLMPRAPVGYLFHADAR